MASPPSQLQATIGMKLHSVPRLVVALNCKLPHLLTALNEDQRAPEMLYETWLVVLLHIFGIY